MKFNLFHIIFLILFICCYNLDNIDAIKDAIKRNKFKNNKKDKSHLPPTVVVFYFEKDKINERKMYASYLREYMATFGMTITNIYLGKKDELIATLQVGDFFDKEYITKTFKGVIRDVLIKDFTKDL